VLHEDKNYYPDAAEVFPGAETVVLDEDAQVSPVTIILFGVQSFCGSCVYVCKSQLERSRGATRGGRTHAVVRDGGVWRASRGGVTCARSGGE
jgi:116 kDa U5 small nuclear ribonucleoprotein component N-terminus